jgi:hypothetical protein
MDDAGPTVTSLESHLNHGTVWGGDDRGTQGRRPSRRDIPPPSHSANGLVGALITRASRSYHACVGCSVLAGMVGGVAVWIWLIA